MIFFEEGRFFYSRSKFTKNSGITNIGFYKNHLVTGSVAVLDFITYLVTKIICIKSNIGDPTLEI